VRVQFPPQAPEIERVSGSYTKRPFFYAVGFVLSATLLTPFYLYYNPFSGISNIWLGRSIEELVRGKLKRKRRTIPTQIVKLFGG
jgi:hypothetical protein